MRLKIIKSLTEESNPVAVFTDEFGVRRFIEIVEDVNDDEIKKLEKMDADELKRLIVSKEKNTEDILRILEDRLLQNKYCSDDGQTISISNKSMQFLPDYHKERSGLYCHGSSGSGKSFLTKKYCKEYKLLKPDNEIFLISDVDDDPSLADLKYIHIKLDKDILRDIDLSTLENSIVIFDDSDTPNDRELSKIVDTLKDNIAQKGRHFNISFFITTHMACNYSKTRILLNECSKYIIFPNSGPSKQMKNMFCTYGGLSGKKFDEIKRVPSRWCMLSTSFPNYLVFDHKIQLLDD